MTLLDAALAYAARGWPVFPCRPGGKTPLTEHGVLDATTSQQQIRAWWEKWADANIGIATGLPGPDVADFDTYGNAEAITAYSHLDQAGLLDGHGAIIKTRSGGLHVYFHGTTQRNGRIPGHHVDFRATGGYVIAPPSYVEADDKGPAGHYTILVSSDATAPIDWRICRDYLDPPPPFQQPQHERAALNGYIRAGDDFAAQVGWPAILSGWTIVRDLGNGVRYWRRPGKTGPGISASTRDDGGLYVFSTSTEFEPEHPYTKFGAWALLQGYGTDYSRAAAALRTLGFGEQPQPASHTTQTATGDLITETHRSHLRLAERLALRYTGHLRHAYGVGWLVWDGTRWQADNDGFPMRAAISVVRDAVAEAAARKDKDLGSDARRTETAHALSSVLTIASCLKPLAVSAAQLDPDPWLFNCTNGTLDLRTGELRPHDPCDLITRIAGCEYDPHATGATFTRFLTEILPDAGVRDFIQRLFGYSMLGLVLEHVLAIFTGTGSNGKTTLIEAVKSAFGDYAITAEPDLLIEKSHGHPTGQADLLGVRLAITAETEGRLAPATVKRLTGGDRIRARKMRQDFFEFEPSHTVLMVTNHKPKVSGDDPALWRRLRVVPFDVVITRPDSRLGEQLRLELPAVLAWAYSGYQGYADHQLDQPELIAKRTAAYRASSDALGRFLEDNTIEQSFASVRARELYGAWARWCAEAGEESGSEVQFADAMGGRGFAKKRTAVGQVYQGVGLRVDREMS